MALLVYLLCAITAMACAILLLRAFARTRSRLLFWSGLCFAALTVNNALVFVDLVLVPSVSLFTWRNIAAFISIAILLFGLVWESR